MSKSKPPTLPEIAEVLGVTVRRVSMLKNEGMPTASIAAARAWREAQAGRNAVKGDSAEELRQKRIALLKQQERRAKLAADEQAGLLIPRHQAEAESYAAGCAVRGALLKLENDLPPRLEGLTASAICQVLRAEFRQVLETLADADSELWRSPITRQAVEHFERLHRDSTPATK